VARSPRQPRPIRLEGVLFVGSTWLTVNGLTIGLLAVGLVLVYKSNRFLNLAHAQLGTLSALLVAKWVPPTRTPPPSLHMHHDLRAVVVCARGSQRVSELAGEDTLTDPQQRCRKVRALRLQVMRWRAGGAA